MRSGAWRIASIYFVIALIWITLSDRALYIFQNTLTPDAYLAIGSAKGYCFVAITAFFLYRLIRNNELRSVENIERTVQSEDEAKRLGNIITKVNNIIIITDKNNFISWVNKAFEDFTGYGLEEVAGYAPSTFFVTGDTDAELLNTILKKKRVLEAFSAEVNCQKKCGSKFWVHGEYTPLFDDKNKFTGYIAVYNDITSLKYKESETGRQNDKLKEVAWLSSHEVRRPLANIIGLINLMNETPYMDEKVKILSSINKSAEELDHMVHVINSTIGVELEAVEANGK